MSETQDQDTDTDVETQVTEERDYEAEARKQGWRPREELRIEPKNGWLDAKTFIERGENEMPLMRDRIRAQDREIENLQRTARDTQNLLADTAERIRTTDDRAYKRAKAELERQRDSAIADADVAGVKRIDAEMRDLDQTAPKPVGQVAPKTNGVDPEAMEWGNKNSWYFTDPEMREEAEMLHIGLLNKKPNLSVAENLKEVTEKIKKMYPEKFENVRRNSPAAVLPSGASQPIRKADPFGFDALPADAKSSFEKYNKALRADQKKVTKDEWAKFYHDDEVA